MVEKNAEIPFRTSRAHGLNMFGIWAMLVAHKEFVISLAGRET